MSKIEELDAKIENLDKEIKAKQKKKQELVFERRKEEIKVLETAVKDSGYSPSEVAELVKAVPRDQFNVMKSQNNRTNNIKENISNETI